MTCQLTNTQQISGYLPHEAWQSEVRFATLAFMVPRPFTIQEETAFHYRSDHLDHGLDVVLFDDPFVAVCGHRLWHRTTLPMKPRRQSGRRLIR